MPDSTEEDALDRASDSTDPAKEKETPTSQQHFEDDIIKEQEEDLHHTSFKCDYVDKVEKYFHWMSTILQKKDEGKNCTKRIP